MAKPSPLVVSGSIAIDRIMSFSGKYTDLINPDKLDSLSVTVFIDKLHDAEGGNGGNISYSMALLGSRPFLLGSIGKSGLLYMERLAHLGVDISHVHESELPTASFAVLTDGQQNQIGGFYPGAMMDSDTLSVEPWKDQDPIVVVAPQDPKAMLRLSEQCRDWGLRLCYDIGQQVSNQSSDMMAVGIDAAHILILNEYEMTQLSERTGRSIEAIKAEVPIVITTLGKDGSVIEGKDVAEPIHIGTVTPKQVADPTGAGDAYRAGFLHGYARGWPLKTCGQLGATIATFAVETMSPQPETFTYGQAVERYEETFGKDEILREKDDV